jgi:sortase A
MDTLLNDPTSRAETPPAPGRPSRSVLRRLEQLLLTIGVVALGYCFYVEAERYLDQYFENRALDRILQSAPPPSADATTAVPTASFRPEPGSRIGRIEIPRLGLSAVVLAGSDARTLRRSVGHIPGTALPGAVGNVGLAGHRDTFFRRLQDVRPDDEVVFTTVDGVYRYRVQRTDVVKPTDVWVLNPTATATLTLVTCYPFTYIGPAPERFIVRASMDQMLAAGLTRPALQQ